MNGNACYIYAYGNFNDYYYNMLKDNIDLSERNRPVDL